MNIILNLIECLRRDHCSLYGYVRETTPNIDALARSSTVFTNCTSGIGTKPSWTTLMTGTTPEHHGVDRRQYTLLPKYKGLPEIIGDAATTAVIANGIPLIQCHLTSKFDKVVYLDLVREHDKPEQGWRTLAAAKELLGVLPEPYFLIIHYMDTHGKYQAGEDEGRFADDELARTLPTYDVDIHPTYQLGGSKAYNLHYNRYDEAIFHVDKVVGELIGELPLHKTSIIITGDHGEKVSTIGRTFQHYKPECTEVPLVWYFPDGTPQVVEDAVGHEDILPTLLDYHGLEIPEQVTGRSLMSYLRDDVLLERLRALGYVE